MKLQLESQNIQDYLKVLPPVIAFDSPLVQHTIKQIESVTETKKERAKMAFEIARDQIAHAFDTGDQLITVTAEETLENKVGICFAKAHLLATLLRGMGIPAGFCYQRVMRKGTPESGFALHGLNALFLEDVGWFRVDPRGNKPGVDAQFSTETEQLAYPIRTEQGEVDYPKVYTQPLDSVITAMHESEDCGALFYNRPERI